MTKKVGERGFRFRRPVRGEAQLSPETRRALDAQARSGRLSLRSAVVVVVVCVLAVIVAVAVAIAFDVHVVGAVVGSMLAPCLALLGVAWRARRGPKKLDRSLRRYLGTLERTALMAPEYDRSAQAAGAARAALQAGQQDMALSFVTRMMQALSTVEVDPRIDRAMQEVALRADDMANPTTGRWTPGLVVLIGGLLGFIVVLPILVGESPAAPMILMFSVAALVGGVACRFTPKRHETWACALPIIACVVVIGLMGWPDILNLAGFIGVLAGALVGMHLRDRAKG